MNVSWRKVSRDFWQERVRTALVTLAIALGIAAFSAVLSSYAILTRELDQGYLETNPASATVRVDAIDDALLQAIAAHPAVAAAEARRSLTGRIKVGPVEWRNLTLFVVKDFGDIRVSTLKPQQGHWPPATGDILIERDAIQVAKARLGDNVIVRMNSGKEFPLRFSGTVKDVGQAQARMENLVYGYITLATLAQLGEEPYLDQVKLIVAENRLDEQHIHRVADEVKRLIESRGRSVRRIDVPEPGKHPHSQIMGLLLLVMSSFGLFVLLLSGILVVNLLTAMMAVQVRQIGVMKAIGGTRWQIARIYFGQALLLGIAAVVLALPLGIWGSRMLCRYMAIFLNFDINSFAVPLWVYLLVAAIGLVAPLLAAAWPVWKGSGVSVREALSDFGVSRNAFGTTAFDRALAGMSGITRPLLLAIRNSFRRRTRLALTLTTLVAGGIFFMAALNVRASLIYTLDRLFATRQFDLTVNLGSMQSWEKVERAVRNTSGVARAEGWIASEAAIVTAASASSPANEESHSITGLHESNGEGNRRFGVMGLPAGTTLLKPEIVEGRNLQPGETEAVMVVNSALATAEGARLKVGSSVLLRIGSTQQAWRIVGIAREPFSPQVAYIPMAYFEQQDGHRGMVNNVRLALEKTDKDSINAVKTALDRTLAQEGVRAQSSSSLADSRYSFDQHMVMIYVFLIIMSCIVAGVGGLGLMTTMSLNVLERRREMGILRAVGAAPSVVWLIVAAEGVVIGVLSWAIAALLAWPLNQALGNLLIKVMFKSSMNFRFELVGAFIWFVVSLCLGAIASFLPAWQAARRPVREAIGYE